MKLRFIYTAILIAISWVVTAQTTPKYVFYFIGDGMGFGPVMTTQAYNRDVLKSERPLLMMQFPVVSWCMTYSANSPITDSAAAGTALSTGFKTNNSMLGVTPDSLAVTSIAREFKNRGYGVGIVTSVAPDDATPGAFYAHVPSRSRYYDIDIQAAESGYEFMAGAGLRGLVDENNVPNDVEETMARSGVQLVYGLEGMKEMKSDRVFLLNPKDKPNYNIGYTIDSIAGSLTLPVMTQACLDHLVATTPDSFFMMVEGGNIDHALHGNDGGAALKEILNFDQSIAIAYDFYLRHPEETLIVVTADHDTGGMANVYSKIKIPNPLSVFDYQRVSKEEFSNYCKAMLRSRRVYRWEDMQEYLEDNLGLFSHVPVNEETLGDLQEMFDDTFKLRNSIDQKTLYANFNAFAVEVFRLVNDAAGVAFTTMSHSGNPVPVFAIGVGAERFGSLNDNTEIPKHIRRIAGL